MKLMPQVYEQAKNYAWLKKLQAEEQKYLKILRLQYPISRIAVSQALRAE